MYTFNPLSWGATTFGLLGGLALFLFGMEQMTDALKVVAGSRMKAFLGRWTSNRFRGVFAGAFVTAVIQSSSVTTVMVVSFVAANMLTLQQSIGIIMGANIGTTVTAHLVAFKVTQYALVMVAVGFGIVFFSKKDRLRHLGNVIMGLGLLFFGMDLMGQATAPLQAYPPFLELMRRLSELLPAMIVSALFTALIQSSSATTGLIIVFAGEGVINLETGIAMVLGANIGTSVTAVLASVGQPRAAVQTAAVHIIFNILGALLWIPLIVPLAEGVRLISPLNLGRQIAWATTIFNVGNTLIFIWFTRFLIKLVQYLIPERLLVEPEVVQPKYLDDVLLDTPALALDRVRLELGHLGAYTLRMARRAVPVAGRGTEEDLRTLARMDDDVDILHEAIIQYLGRLSQASEPAPQLKEQAADYLAAANYIESIADMIETNVVEVGVDRLSQGVQVSRATQERLNRLYERVYWAIEQALQALIDSDARLAEQVIAAKPDINRLAREAESQVVRRLTAAEPRRVATFRLESELIEYLKRMYYFAKRIAKIVAQIEETHAIETNLTLAPTS
jgi:phosphate:Na+ symporter